MIESSTLNTLPSIMTIKRYIDVMIDDGMQKSYVVDVPDACPICHRHSEIKVHSAWLVDRDTSVQAIFRCGYDACGQFFFCYYGPPTADKIVAVRPIKPMLRGFSESVHAISPTFVSVYAEAEEAAQLDLKQIAGPGYRKAFEFLIKDYAKSIKPDRSAEIEKMSALAVVKEFIADPRIQEVAKRSLWLGNDETHYLRKWVDHDLVDLVVLIQSSVHWIEIDYLSTGYVASMPDPRGPGSS